MEILDKLFMSAYSTVERNPTYKLIIHSQVQPRQQLSLQWYAAQFKKKNVQKRDDSKRQWIWSARWNVFHVHGTHPNAHIFLVAQCISTVCTMHMLTDDMVCFTWLRTFYVMKAKCKCAFFEQLNCGHCEETVSKVRIFELLVKQKRSKCQVNNFQFRNLTNIDC